MSSSQNIETTWSAQFRLRPSLLVEFVSSFVFLMALDWLFGTHFGAGELLSNLFFALMCMSIMRVFRAGSSGLQEPQSKGEVPAYFWVLCSSAFFALSYLARHATMETLSATLAGITTFVMLTLTLRLVLFLRSSRQAAALSE